MRGEISDEISQVPTRRILTFIQNEKSPPQPLVIFHARNIREAKEPYVRISHMPMHIHILRFAQALSAK